MKGVNTDGRRPLYLDPSDTLRVRREGPSLVVDDSMRRYRRYPLRLLSRIVCRGAVRWRGDALQATLDAGVAVAMVDEQGSVSALCAPAAEDRLSLADHLELAICSPTWPDRYPAWRRAQEGRLMRLTAGALRLRLSADPRPAEAWSGVVELLQARHGSVALEGLRRLEAPLRAHVCSVLAAHGVRAEFIQGWRGTAALGSDLAALLRWPLAGRLVTLPAPAPTTFREAAGVYERWLAGRIEPTIGRLVHYLWRLRP